MLLPNPRGVDLFCRGLKMLQDDPEKLNHGTDRLAVFDIVRSHLGGFNEAVNVAELVRRADEIG